MSPSAVLRTIGGSAVSRRSNMSNLQGISINLLCRTPKGRVWRQRLHPSDIQVHGVSPTMSPERPVPVTPCRQRMEQHLFTWLVDLLWHANVAGQQAVSAVSNGLIIILRLQACASIMCSCKPTQNLVVQAPCCSVASACTLFRWLGLALS